MELLGKVRDRSVRTPEALQNAASGGVRERGERGVQVSSLKLNHPVQHITRIGGMQGEVERVNGGQSREPLPRRLAHRNEARVHFFTEKWRPSIPYAP